MARIQEQVVLGGRYRLESRIAAGGMGTVWVAEDQVLHRQVAVKILSDALGQDVRFVERFRREARAAAGLSHRNVAGVYDYGEEGGLPFIVMELLGGETLADRIERQGRLPAAEAAKIAGQVAAALQAAHDAGVIHRDVKPANVMLTPRGEVKVMDFGIAAASGAAPLTATGTTMGTASYLSPEQAAGERATPASDVYALGCVLYEMLTGHPPFTGDSAFAVAGAHLRDRATPVRDLAPDVPAHVADACDLALAKDPADRPGSARMFAAMLIDPPVGASTTQVLPAPEPTAVLGPLPVRSSTGSVAPPRRRRRVGAVIWVLIAVLVAIAVAAVVLSSITQAPSKPKKQHATPATVQVPQVTGLTYAQAAAKVRAAGLVPASILVKGPRDIVRGVVPSEGIPVKRGDSVTLYVGNGDNGHGGKGNDKQKKD
jgi:eukaryotic-like serine/threonine-protein kinase